jgi:thioesterase domain-containing protein
MARQLEESGESVSFLGLLDPGAPLAETNAGLASSRRWERFSRAMHAEQGSALRRFGRKVAKAARKVKNLVTYELSRRTTETLAEVRFRALRKTADAGRPVPRLAEGLTVRQTYVRAEREYIPAGALAAPVVLFRATSGEGADEPFANLYTDPLLGWGRWVKDGPEVVDVPGGHSSMLQEPHVAVMAGRIREAVSRQPMPAVLTGAAEAAV